MNNDSNRRKFLKALGGISAAVTASGAFSKAESGAPAAASGAKYMGGFAAPKLEKVRVAIIGVGARGSGHSAQLSTLEGVQMVGICDLHEDSVRAAAKIATEHGHDPKLYFGDENLWRKMLEEVKPDAVFVVTPWQLHSPMLIAAMKAGAHAFTEVPMGLTEKELWEVIDTSETTGRHCMMMENVNYGREELLYLNMVRQGVIGELLHGEAAYIHDLREQMKEVERGTGSWRTYHWAQRNGNLYPTHGLGPVAQYMSLARTDDTFRRLTSFSSPSKGHQLYAKENFPADMKWNTMQFTGGDMNTSIIKTVLGRTIMIQWDETSPRPYSRHNLITGTKGTLAGFPNRMAIEGLMKTTHEWTTSDEFEAIAIKYEHPLFKRMGQLAQKMGGHGGMDFLMLYRIIECLRTGAPLDQNVYEGALWSVVSPLSEKSVKKDGAPQDFPDFTRGNWKTTKPLEIIA